MYSNFTHALDELSARYHALKKPSRFILLIVGMLLVIGATAMTLRPAPLTDLAEGHHLRNAHFYALWDKGEVVVLLRHVERCDHSTNPCLAEPDGITAKGRRVADHLGQSFQALGLDKADIYHSTLRRAEQTAAFAFNRTSPGQDWLINCRKTMLDDVVKHKVDGHNLILVTHSECITALEKQLNARTVSSLDYGASLVLSVNPSDHSTKIMGYIDAQDWETVLSKRP